MPAMNRITQNITMPLTNGRRVTATNAAKVGGTYFRKQRYHPRCAACQFFTTLFFRRFGYHRHPICAGMLIELHLHSVARNKIRHPGCSQKYIDSAAYIAGIHKAIQCCYRPINHCFPGQPPLSPYRPAILTCRSKPGI
jgi:hypothetical protein